MGQHLSRAECHWFPQVRAMGVQVGFRARKGNNAYTAPSGSEAAAKLDFLRVSAVAAIMPGR
jgi:hypothetical protein